MRECFKDRTGLALVLAAIILISFVPLDAAALSAGDKAPLFTSRMLDGGDFTLTDNFGKNVVLLNFWSVYCKDCISRIEALNKINDLYQSRDFKLLGIAGDPPTDRMLRQMKKYAVRMHYPVILDPELFIYDSYGVDIVPFAVLIDKDGNVVMAIQSLEPEPLKAISDRINQLTSR